MVTVVGACILLASCQDGTKVAAGNRCKEPIEADLHDVADPVGLGYELHWEVLQPGATGVTRTGSDPLRRLYVWVRLPGSTVVPEPLVFEPSDLESSDHKEVAVIVGDLCPGQ